MLYESVLTQFERSLGHDWVDTIVGKPLPPTAGDRRCGIYLQNQYPEPGRQVLAIVADPRLPEPAQFSRVFGPGRIARADRADRAATAMWKTELADHRETVAGLVGHRYASFVYAKGLTGRPLLLVFEPTAATLPLIERADRDGHDVVVFHTGPLPDENPDALGAVAASHALDSWADAGSCADRIVAACAGHEVAGSHCEHEPAAAAHRLVRERLGLAPDTADTADTADAVTA
jgi:hypothetical protein